MKIRGRAYSSLARARCSVRRLAGTVNRILPVRISKEGRIALSKKFLGVIEVQRLVRFLAVAIRPGYFELVTLERPEKKQVLPNYAWGALAEPHFKCQHVSENCRRRQASLRSTKRMSWFSQTENSSSADPFSAWRSFLIRVRHFLTLYRCGDNSF
jgi:hypothetical protein